MSNVVIITVLAGNILSQATVGSMDECLAQREATNSQQGLTAYCVYQDEDAQRKQIELLLDQLFLRLGEDPREFGEPEEIDPLEGMDWRTM